MAWKTIWQTSYPHEAHMAKNYLESEGFTCVLRDELTAQVGGFLYTRAIGGVRLMVSESEKDDALAKLRQGGYVVEHDELKKRKVENVSVTSIEDKTVCPFCESKNIGRMRGRGVNWLTLLVFALLMVLVPSARKTRICFDCGKEWRFT